MSFQATVKSLSIYPKENHILIYAVLEQKGKYVKGVIQCGVVELQLLVKYKQIFRFFTTKAPTSTYYKQTTIPMFDITNFTAIATNNQPTITNTFQPKPSMPQQTYVDEPQPIIQQMDIEME